MKVLNLELADELREKSKEELSVLLDKEIERFSQWMANECPDPVARSPLSRPERAILKTYLVQKLAGRLNEVD